MISVPTLRRDLSAVHVVSAEQAHRLWCRVLARQGLAGGPKLESATEAATRSLGLHTARLPSPFATLLARLADPAAADALFAAPETPDRLVTVRCMRKTLHTLPPAMAGVAHTATRSFRERDAIRLAGNVGLTAASLARLVTQVRQLLADTGPLGYREVESRIHAAGVEVPAVRAAIKVAWEAGHLAYLNTSQYWNREERRFALTARVAPSIVPDGDQGQAAAQLVTDYFDRYGPASLRDATWWSGLSQRHVLQALRTCGRDVVSIRTPQSPAALYMFDSAPDAADPMAGEGEGGVDFLAHEDVALKAYFTTRDRYLGSLHPRQVFNQIGEVRPTIMRDGRLIGTWNWDPRRRCVTWALFTRNTSSARKCENRAAELTTTLRERHDSSRNVQR